MSQSSLPLHDSPSGLSRTEEHGGGCAFSFGSSRGSPSEGTLTWVEPPSCSSASSIVFIGRNSRGNWVAKEQNGLFGGLFVSRKEAVKYALFENGRHPETIVELSREIELDMGGFPSSDHAPAARTLSRRVA